MDILNSFPFYCIRIIFFPWACILNQPFQETRAEDTDVRTPPPSNHHTYNLQSDPVEILVEFIISKPQHIYNDPIVRR